MKNFISPNFFSSNAPVSKPSSTAAVVVPVTARVLGSLKEGQTVTMTVTDTVTRWRPVTVTVTVTLGLL